MYLEFLRRLETLHAQPKSNDLTSIEILGMFLDPHKNLFRDIETVLSFLCRAAVSKSVESVVESWISTLEKHAAGGRMLGQDRMEDECSIAINGPGLAQSKEIVKAAHTEYWSKAKRDNELDGHFVRRSEKMIPFTISKVIDKSRAEKPRLPFMV